MTSIVIPEIDDDLSERLQRRADAYGRSVEAEAQTILQQALAGGVEPTGRDLAKSIREKFAPFDPVDLDLPPRYANREPPRFDGEWFCSTSEGSSSTPMSSRS